MLQVVSLEHLKRDLCLTQQLIAANFAVMIVLNRKGTVNFDEFQREIGSYFGVDISLFDQQGDMVQFLQQDAAKLLARQKAAAYANQMPSSECLQREHQQFRGTNDFDPTVFSLIEKRYALAAHLASQIVQVKQKPRIHLLDRPAVLIASFIMVIFCLFSLLVIYRQDYFQNL